VRDIKNNSSNIIMTKNMFGGGLRGKKGMEYFPIRIRI